MSNENKEHDLGSMQSKSAVQPRKQHVVLAMALISAISVMLLFIATFILIQLKFKESIEFVLSDWIKVISPIVGGAIITIFAFLGVDRLKNFDERQDMIARNLKESLDVRMDHLWARKFSEWDNKLNEKSEDLTKRFRNLSNNLDETEKRFEEIFGKNDNLSSIDSIGNVSEAHDYLAKMFQEDEGENYERARLTRAIVKMVTDGSLRGDSNDYHNLASELARQDYFAEAAAVLRQGRERHPSNIDILCGIIYFSVKSGDKAEEERDELLKISFNQWNWRAYTFYIDTLNLDAATDTSMDETLKVVEEYKNHLPEDERAYMAEYETYRKYGELKKAETALENAELCLAMTAQCSLTLSQIYLMRGEYDQATLSATRAIIGQAEAQPSSSTGAAFAQRAFAKDAKINMLILKGISEEELNDEIRSAIEDYDMALSCGYSGRNLLTRKKILRTMIPGEKDKDSEQCLEDRMEKLEKAVAILYRIVANQNGETN